MENAAGEDLAWYWRGWFLNNYKLDLALISANYVGGDTKNGVEVVVANKEAMAMPFSIEAKLKDGTKLRMKLPVETWIQNKATTFVIPTTSAVESVSIDPEATLPDVNRKNNSLTVK